MRTLLLALAACNVSNAAPAAKVSDVPTDKESQSLTAELQKMNGSDYGKPAAKWNAGTVTPKEAPAAKKTKLGFEIKFGNASAVSTPAIYQGKLYTSGGFNSRELYAYDATTGKAAFGLALSDDGPSSIACDDGTCAFNTESCTTFAIDSKTGKARWAWFLGDPQTSSPSIAGGRVFTTYPGGAVEGNKPRPPGASHVLVAFDLATGKVQWQDWLDAEVISAPVAVGEFLYVSTYNGTVIKLEQATGKIRYASKAHATSAPVVQFDRGLETAWYTRRADQVKKAAKAEEQIVRTDHNEPEEKYSTPAKESPYLDSEVQSKAAMKGKASQSDAGNGFSGGAPAAAAPHKAMAQVGQSNVATIQQFQGSRILHVSNLNVNTMGDEVIATSSEDGKQVWSHKLSGDMKKDGGFLGAPPIAAGNHLIVATLHGTVLELDPKTGKVEQSFEVGGTLRSQPVADNGWIYVGTDDGRLVAIDTGDRTITGWPMWGGNAQRTGIGTASK